MISSQSSIPAEIRAGVLINPLSGTNRRNPIDNEKLSARFLVPVKNVLNDLDIDRTLEEFARAGVNVLVVCSGDGTIQGIQTSLFLNRPFETVPPLVIVRGGTTNMTAGDVGVRGDVVEVLEKLEHLHDSSEVMLVSRDVMQVELPGIGRRYGMFFASAGICQAMAFYQRHLHHRSLWGLPGIILTFSKYMFNVLIKSEARRQSTLTIGISIDGGSITEEKFLLLMLTTLRRLIFGMRPFAERAGESGHIHLTGLASKTNHLLLELPGIIKGHPSSRATRENGYWLADIGRAELLIDGNVALDGELYEISRDAGPVILENGETCSFIKW